VFRLPFLFLAGVNAELEEEDRRSLVDEFVSCLAFYLLSIVNSSTKHNLPVLFSVGSSGSWILKANHPGTRALHRGVGTGISVFKAFILWELEN